MPAFDAEQIFGRRRSGILLHPTSLPGEWDNGDLGDNAFRFVDFLAATGQTIWQMLPLGPTHDGGSPYQCLSVHAGNPRLISIDRLVSEGMLDDEDVRRYRRADSEQPSFAARERLLERARQAFFERADEEHRTAYERFASSHDHWLADYALFQALRIENELREWSQWPASLRDRDTRALAKARDRHCDTIELVRFEQFLFHRQWTALKAYANDRGVLLFGDIPIFVAYDSVDVWANRDIFRLDERGHPLVVAGVPPDYFSATGQLWGNPHYDWEHMKEDGFSWWMKRIESQFEVCDLVRIDHFRGFESYWEVPVGQENAIGGRWVKGPGELFFETTLERFGSLPFVAEDLGLITPQVYALRDKYHLPGMRVLQFAFDGKRDNPYLPHNHERNSVVYTGTHDNDTTLGWYESASEDTCAYVKEYLGGFSEPMPWPLIRTALRSVANTCIIPMQDLLGLGSEHRMNTPGTTTNNWTWRFDWDQLTDDTMERLARIVDLYGR